MLVTLNGARDEAVAIETVGEGGGSEHNRLPGSFSTNADEYQASSSDFVFIIFAAADLDDIFWFFISKISSQLCARIANQIYRFLAPGNMWNDGTFGIISIRYQSDSRQSVRFPRTNDDDSSGSTCLFAWKNHC